MIKENYFYIDKIKKILFLGYTDILGELFEINNKLGIKSYVVTSTDQNKKIKNQNIIANTKTFNKLDPQFRSYIKKNFEIENTLFISLSARWIFKKDTINFLKQNLINFHSSRLPLDRGGATFSWQIMKGDRIHANSAHIVDESVDTGPILFARESLYPHSCKIPVDFESFDKKKLKIFYTDLVKKIIKHKKILLKIQSEELSSYNPRINSSKDSWIDWNLNPYDLVNFINAFDEPYEGAKTFLNGNIVKIKSVHLTSSNSGYHPFMSGIVSRKNKNWLVVNVARSNSLIIEKVLNTKNKNILEKIKLGDRFFTYSNELSTAKAIRSRFNTFGLKKNIKKLK